jgi:hypothetical protein
MGWCQAFTGIHAWYGLKPRSLAGLFFLDRRRGQRSHTVSSIEDRLIELKYTKKTYGTKHTCFWTAPNGRAFHAPNPNVYSMVPADTMESVLDRFSDVMKLPSIH